MCGIIYVSRHDTGTAQKIIRKQYHRQELRGSQGFGYIAIDNGKIVSYRKATTETEILSFLKTEKAKDILFHHRMPTSTPNITESAHPIVVERSDLKYIYHCVHNGIISNSDTLKEKHEKLGFSYTTRLLKKWLTPQTRYTSEYHNDSEALAIELALYLEGKQKTLEVVGSVAFMLLQTMADGSVIAMYYGRGTSPLSILDTKNYRMIASEASEDDINHSIIYRMDWQTRQVTEIPTTIGDTPAPVITYPKTDWSDYTQYPKAKNLLAGDTYYLGLQVQREKAEAKYAQAVNSGRPTPEITALEIALDDIEQEIMEYEADYSYEALPF